MALTMRSVLRSGITLDNVYFRIDSIRGDKTNIDATLGAYVSESIAQNDGIPLEQRTFSFAPSVDDDSPNFIKQGYEYLKTQPEYAQATDA